MLRFCLDLFAKTLSKVPESCLAASTEVLGALSFATFKKRRSVILSNLSHAFPEKSHTELIKIAKTSVARMFEMSLLSFCAGKFCNKRVQRSLEIPQKTQDFFEKRENDTRPVIYLVPHLTLMEMQPWLKTVVPSQQSREITCIYRSLNQTALEDHIKASRETNGMRFRSRKEGLLECMYSLRKGGQVSILFDQNARKSGALVLFMDRLCAATDLPGILAKKFKPEVRIIWVERMAFWRGKLQVETLPDAWTKSPEVVTAGAQLWLEKLFKESPKQIPDWLWSHKRWGAEARPAERFALQNDKVWLEVSAKLKGDSQIPRNTRVVMHLPQVKEEIDALIPTLNKIRKARPDMAFWMMAQPQVLKHPKIEAICDEAFPCGTLAEATSIVAGLQKRFPDLICDWVIDSSLALQWKRAECPQIFGIATSEAKAAGYSHCHYLKSEDGIVLDFKESSLRFAEKFGLPVET